jgi:hypothetical protein
VTVDSERQGAFVTPRATPGYVAWGDGNASGKSTTGGYVYDFDHERLLSFGNTAGLYLLRAHGSLLAWQESTGPKLDDITTVIGRLP